MSGRREDRERRRGDRRIDPRLDRGSSRSIFPWRRRGDDRPERTPEREAIVECGWGRVVFAHTFDANERIAEVLRGEVSGRRDIAFYVADPHVVVSLAPQELFLDPSHGFRLWLDRYRPSPDRSPAFHVHAVYSLEDARQILRIYDARQMVAPTAEFLWESRTRRDLSVLVALDAASQRVLGTVMGIDHVEAFGDPEKGTSLWALAVDPQVPHPGVGETLVRHLVEHYQARGRAFLDLSVMHDNQQAIALYEKLGFERIPVFAVKRKNPINEQLFVAPEPDAALNPYAEIIVDEARRRGIQVEVLDAENAYFRLTLGGRSVVCRESLSELTSAIAMSRCDDKQVTRRVLLDAGLAVPEQRRADGSPQDASFLAEHGRVVVKPRRGEQGAGVTVDVRTPEQLQAAIVAAERAGEDGALIERFCPGRDLRVIVIDDEVVAAAVRRPPEVTGTGRHTIRELIEKQSRRRAAATGGESRIPIDAATEDCLAAEGFGLDDVLRAGRTLRVRRAANLHQGGTIHDVTGELHPGLADASLRAARALGIPVVGLDLIVPSPREPGYVIIEANERAGLANHEPQPTAQRFLDFLFPQSATPRPARRGGAPGASGDSPT